MDLCWPLDLFPACKNIQQHKQAALCWTWGSLKVFLIINL